MALPFDDDNVPSAILRAADTFVAAAKAAEFDIDQFYVDKGLGVFILVLENGEEYDLYHESTPMPFRLRANAIAKGDAMVAEGGEDWRTLWTGYTITYAEFGG